MHEPDAPPSAVPPPDPEAQVPIEDSRRYDPMVLLEQEMLVITLLVAFVDGICRAKVLDSAAERTARDLKVAAVELRMRVEKVTRALH